MVEKIKKAIDPLYADRCTVYEKKSFNEDGRTRFEEVVVYENIPCRISAKSYLFGEKAAGENDNVLEVKKKVKLFLPDEYVVKPGSKIRIVSKNRESVYGKSGEMSFYSSHNEVMIELLKNYA